MLLSAILANVCVSVRPSVCQLACMPMCRFLCPTICSSVHPFICIIGCFFQRVNVSACGQGYLSVLLFDRRSAHPYQCKYTVLFMFLSVCQPDRILSVCVRPSVKCCVFKLQIVLLLVCYSIGLYDFFSFVRPSDRPSVHPSCRRSVSLSLMHVCMSVIFLISNSKFLTSNFDIYSRVCMRAYESVRPMCARI